MRCFHPMTAWFVDGQKVPVINESQPRNAISDSFGLRCGRCIGCRIQTAESWVVRCVHESRMHKWNSVVTLTYDPKFVPYQGQLVYSHFQKFVRKARRKLGPFSYYGCGEYGDISERPHFHACLFGLRFPDRKYFKRAGDGSNLYTSAVLSDLWGKGHCTVGDFSSKSAAYVARYVVKKVTGERASSHYERIDTLTGEVFQLEPEFNMMSLKPAIGKRFWDKYKEELLVRDGCIVDGKAKRVPKTYDRWLTAIDPMRMGGIESERQLKALPYWEDMTAARLAVQEVCAKAVLSVKQRGNDI